MPRIGYFLGIWLLSFVVACASAESSDDYEPNDGLDDTGRDGGDGSVGDAKNDANGPDAAPGCEGVVCQSPPASVCEDASTVRFYEAEGVCKEGVCEYPSTSVPCPFGCTKGACEGNPCEGVSCNGPPKNECVDATTLKAFSPNGTCGKEGCQYSHELLPCSHGCADGKCKDDPCVGVVCATPPANECDGASYLLTYQPAGTCDANGDCVYVEERKSCQHGCKDGVCNDDPCLGITCTTPWASYCQDDKLVAYKSPGTCSGGVCSYTKREPLEHCTYGCDEIAGKCKGNPCLGVSCETPEADYCIGTTTLVRFLPKGTCGAADGQCSYGFEEIECPCEDGVCKDCLSDGDCDEGKFCNDNSCTTCDRDQHCGEACSDCTASGDVCDKGSGSCVECTAKGHCAQGSHCVDNQCTTCASDEACGPSCEPCGAQAPYCLGSGMSGRCVECRNDGDCESGKCNPTTKTCGVSPLCQAAIDSAATALANSSGWKHAKMDGMGSGWNWDFWQYGKPTSGPGACHEGTNCWATNLTGNYINCQRADLRTPSVNLSACAEEDDDLKLVFWHWYDFWTARYPTSNGPMRYDGGLVELSGNGGASWVAVNAVEASYSGTTNINRNMGSSYVCTSGNNFYVHNKPGYVGTSGGWQRVEVTIPKALRTSQLMVRFAYASGVSFGTTSQTPNSSRAAPGWYLDGVSIEAP